jgi:transposase-like protein
MHRCCCRGASDGRAGLANVAAWSGIFVAHADIRVSARLVLGSAELPRSKTYCSALKLCSREVLAAAIAIPVPRRLTHSQSMRLTLAEPDRLDLVRSVREARFADARACVHCGAGRVVRWGAFAGRQRYRCRGCHRTFSDLTRTAFAYTKKISKWPQYLVLMRQGQTLRRSAKQLDLHVSTVFRWRHALLTARRSVDATTLGGTLELKEISFAFSLKGCRSVARPRARGARYSGWSWHETTRDRVLLAVARNGATHSATIGGDMVVTPLVADWVRARLTGTCIVFGRMPKAGPCASAVRAGGHDYTMLRKIVDPDPLSTCHTRNVDAFASRLFAWLARFRGVASKYRENYLLWHRLTDRDGDLLWARRIVVGSIPLPAKNIQTGHGLSISRPP